jgi:tyrosyl-tRNA synthetase
MAATKGEARRTAKGGGVRVDGDKIEDGAIVLTRGRTFTLSVGKRRKALIRLD